MTHPKDGSSRIDRGRHPALFQRVTRSTPPVSEKVEPRTVSPAVSTDIYAAFAEYIQFRPAEIRHRDNRVRPGSTAVWDFLDASGFYPEEVEQLKLGVYTTPEDVRGALRSLGFSEAAIADTGLVVDERGHTRHDWHGGLIVPLSDERGQIVDCLAVIPPAVPGHPVRYEFARGSLRSDVSAYGLSTALATPKGRSNLVLVESILEALYLQCRGFTNVAAVGGDGREFSPRRWEELSRLGVEAVTLAFGNDATRQRDVREALDHALRARSAPEVFVLERTQLLENETLADVARRMGLEACRKAASARSLAFHGKDFGWSPSKNGHAAPAFHRDHYRAYLKSEADKLPHSSERAAIQGTIGEVEDAISHRHYTHARAVVEARLGGRWMRAEVRTRDVNSVLDRLCDDAGRAHVPEHLARYDGNELLAGTVTVLANESIRGRLADLCSRVVTALETRPEETWVIICREFSEEAIALGLIAHMTRRMTTAQGLTFEEIQARLSGRDPLDGYSDKPWLVDEAVDRLRRWTDRLTFIGDPHHALYAVDAIERIADQHTLGGVFFDSIPLAWQFDKTWHAGWKQSCSAVSMMRELATRFSCAVVAVTDHMAQEGQVFPAETAAINGHALEPSRTIREFREMISYWIDQEERTEVRIA